MNGQLLQNSLAVIAGHAVVIGGILLLIVLGQSALSRALRFIFKDQLTRADYLALGLTGWLLPASLLSFLWWIFGLIPALTVAAVLGLVLFRFTLRADPQPDSPKIAFFLLTFVSLSILLRLAFVSQAELPAYFDSAQHYLFIQSILQNDPALPLAPLNYYHLGFHTLAAFMVFITRSDIAETMLILGQVTLALVPVSLFFPVKYETRSTLAGMFAVALAAFGWFMPAHAVNWGKYPALMGLGILPFVFSLMVLFAGHRQSLSAPQRNVFYVLLTLGILVAFLAHTRTVIVLVILFLAWGAARYWYGLASLKRYTALILVLSVIVLGTIYIYRQPVFQPLFDPYLRRGLYVSVLVLILSVFALRAYPQWALTCLLAVGLLLGSLFIPVWTPGEGNLTLLDRPFVQMILFMPLSVLGGLGLAGLGKSVHAAVQLPHQRTTILGIVSLALGGLIVVHAFSAYDFYPSNCCVLAGPDDLLAMDWLDENLPAGARVGIAATDLRVLTLETSEGLAGSDAGIWLTPLIERVTVALPNVSDFSQGDVHDALCRTRVTHLYVGGIGQTFDEARLLARPEWYRVFFVLPNVRVYEVAGC